MQGVFAFLFHAGIQKTPLGILTFFIFFQLILKRVVWTQKDTKEAPHIRDLRKGPIYSQVGSVHM